jgi:hypothetical protein
MIQCIYSLPQKGNPYFFLLGRKLQPFPFLVLMISNAMDNAKATIWKDFIRIELAPAQLLSVLRDCDDIGSLISKSAVLREDFINWVLEKSIIIKDEAEFLFFITSHQTLLCFLLNTTEKHIQHSENDPQAHRLYQVIIEDLVGALQFIEEYYPKQFDTKAYVPKPILDAFQRNIDSAELQIRQSVAALSKDVIVCELIVFELRAFSLIPIRFEQLSYLNGFLKDLSNLTFNSSSVSGLSPIVQYCIKKNFNAPAFLEYCSTLLTEDETKERLKQLQKFIQQLAVEYEAALYPQRQAVRDYLLTWIDNELFTEQTDLKKEPPAAEQSIPKINTSVSVPVLALLTRVFKEAGIITNSNLQELFRSVSSHYTSQRTESISTGNFHGKYYTVEESTKRKVTDLLLEMVKLIRKIP